MAYYSTRRNGMGFSTSREFRNQERNVGVEHEVNNIQIVIEGRNWKVIPGGADYSNEMRYAQQQAARIVATMQARGKQASFHITGANPT